MAAGKPEGSDYELGDLDIPASGMRPQRSPAPAETHRHRDELDLLGGIPAAPQRPAPRGQPPAGNLNSFGERDLGDDGFGDAMGGLELELDDMPARPKHAPRPGQSTSDTPAPPKPSSGAPRAKANAAVGSTVPKDASPNVLTALQELAGFGAPPGGWVSSGRYAIHVGLRLLALRSERKRVAQALAAAETSHRSALEALGEALLASVAARNPALAAWVNGVDAARGQVSQADQTLTLARAEGRDAIAKLEAERQRLEQELVPLVEAERAAQGALRKGEEDLKRGQAWEKRVEIELRALHEAGADEPTKLADLERQKQQRASAVAEFEAALRELQAKLTEARRELATKRGPIDALDAQRRILESSALARESAIGKQTEAASEAYRTALRALAEAARERELAGAAASQTARVSECVKLLEEANDVLGQHDRAAALYDHKGVRKGTILLVAIVVIGVLLLLLHPGFES